MNGSETHYNAKKNPIFAAHPALGGKIHHVSLGNYPTPVDRLEGLERALKQKGLFIKREDLSSVLYGGNKLRKLEFLLADAVAKHFKHTVTFGYAGSNHTLATAIFAKKLGLSPISIHLPQSNARYVRKNLLYQKLLNAELHQYGGIPTLFSAFLLISIKRLLTSGRIPYYIPAGGSNALGVVGTASAVFELSDQIMDGVLPKPDLIYLPTGSAGTTAGIALGIKALGLDIKVRGVAVSPSDYSGLENVKRHFNDAKRLLMKCDPTFPDVQITGDDVKIVEGYLGDGYARFTEKGMDAVRLLKISDKVQLEGTYTGKAMAAMIDHASRGELDGKRVLFWNTYNSHDFTDLIKDVDYRTLPKSYHPYFERDFQPLEIED
ncbi:MAG: pyridoxal-phosphate dependent enzyme [Deltaproteobacteria bacterium]|uniref:Pyridoxal-phosphate dependent enzyme n=1 Tax=Candidatus Zymogenus saltonus TaxID=2844893 RepID=A0A9D8KDK8_9DELT|nr:pyridoxal-phosphate dependent enzyme [Candidatus Zymogenus saltonus]